MAEPEPILLFGNGKLAELVLAVAHDDPRYRVVAVTADREYLTGAELGGVPQLALEEALEHFPPGRCSMLVTIGYRRMRARSELLLRARALGYRLPGYVAPRARLDGDVELGENCIVFDLAYLGPGARLGANCVVRPQVYVGHDSELGEHVFLAPGAKLGGNCRVGELSFVGLGAVVVDGTTVAAECLIGAGAVVVRDTEPYGLYLGSPARRVGEHAETGVRLSR